MTVNTSTVTGTTDLLAAIYRDTLGTADLDPDADFYESGGDSLTAFGIIARLQEALEVEIPVSLVFAYPTPAELAAVVDADFIRT